MVNELLVKVTGGSFKACLSSDDKSLLLFPLLLAWKADTVAASQQLCWDHEEKVLLVA